MFRVIAYDIADERRRRKVAEICKDYGVRSQYSVFLCDLTEENFLVFWKKLEQTIDRMYDSVVMFPICGKCRKEQRILGKGQFYEKPSHYLF